MSACNDFRDAIRASGMAPPDVIEPGRFHRFPGAGKRNGNTAGWCKLFPDGMGGVFGDYSRDFVHTWQAKRSHRASPADADAFRRNAERTKADADARQREEQADAAERAAALWEQATPAGDHPYLAAKRIGPHAVRVAGDALLVPMRDSSGKLWNVERIPASGKPKKGLPNGRRTACYHSIGKPNGVICITEGYATGASVHEATGHAVAVAFGAGNLESVGRELRAKYPDAGLTFCADDDYRTAGNPGLTKATAAALDVGGLLAIPDFGDERPEGATDFNDLHKFRGAEAVDRAVRDARAPDVREHQPPPPDTTAADAGPRVDLICAADVTPEAVRWLWNGWIPAGKLCIVAGPPGTGKTTLALAIAATVTVGGRWPDGTRANAADVGIWSGEDGMADTLVPRLAANGANLHRVHIVRSMSDGGERRPFDPATDTAVLALELARLPSPPAVLIVDPIVSAVAGDSHKNSETRRSLQPLVDLGERLGCAIIGISHFSKGTSGRDPVERVTGSIAFGALARVVLGAVKTTGDDGLPGPRLLALAKSNLGPDGGGFHYSLEQRELPDQPGVSASQVIWGAPVEGEARMLLATAEAEPGDEAVNMSGEAADWLRHFLDGGPVPAAEAFREAKKLGFTDKTIRRARERLGVVPRKAGMRGGWEWVLPSVSMVPEDAQDAPFLKRGAFDAFGDAGASSAPAADATEVF